MAGHTKVLDYPVTQTGLDIARSWTTQSHRHGWGKGNKILKLYGFVYTVIIIGVVVVVVVNIFCISPVNFHRIWMKFGGKIELSCDVMT